MTQDQFVYSLPVVGSALLSLFIGVYAWQQGRDAAVRWYAVFAFSQVVWGFGYYGELLSPGLEAKRAWDDFQYIGYYGVLFSLTCFVLHYTGHPWARRKGLLRAWGAALALLCGVALTNQWHGLAASGYRVVEVWPFNSLNYEFELFSYVTFGLGYVLLALLLAVLARHAFQQKRMFRVQSLVIIAGVAIPVIFSLLQFVGVTYLGQRDFVPITQGFANLLIAWGLLRYRLLDLRPVALNQVFASMTDAVLVFDQDQRLVQWNPAAAAWARVGVGLPYEQVFAAWEAPPSLIAGPVVQEERTLNDRTLDVRVSALTAASGQSIGSIVVIHDNTERAVLMQELREQTIALREANTQLILARSAAEQANQTKTQFIATVAHEVRSPLTAMMLFTDLVHSERHGPLNERQKQNLAQALQSARHMRTLLDELLDISKIEAGVMQLNLEPNVDIRPELDAVASIVGTLLRDKPVEWRYEVAPDLPLMTCDRRRVLQILLNLVTNACKFTAEGSVALIAQHTPTHIMFVVQDTGAGIPANHQELVFQPFHQVKAAHAQSGSGLGLSITKFLVEAHQGEIRLESAPGAGSAFTVLLPLKGAKSCPEPVSPGEAQPEAD
jgi:signal transduction histidine kinase